MQKIRHSFTRLASRLTVPTWLKVLVAALLLAGVGMAIGLRLAGPTETDTALGRVSLDVPVDAGGRVDAFVPIADWGIRADAFAAPFRLELEVRSVARGAAVEAASGDREALEGIEGDLEAAARDAVLRAMLWGLLTTTVLAFLVWVALRNRPGRRTVPLTGIGVALAAAVGSVLVAQATFDSEKFAYPSFYGRGEELAQLLDFFEGQQGNERYSSTFEGALTNFSAYLSDSPRPGQGADDSLLFGSDLHNNALVLPALDRFAENRPILLAGDFGHEGNESEARAIAPKISELGSQVIAVSGNHDSTGMMQALVRGGVTVLGKDGALKANGTATGDPTIEVDGLSVAGYPDPLEWRGADPGSPERIFSFSGMEDGEAAEAEAAADLIAWFGALPDKPDILLIHQIGLARDLAEDLRSQGYDEPLTIVTGHDHYQGVDRWGPIAAVNGGTLGAGGFLRLGQESVGLGLIYMAGTPPALEAVDLIEVEPLSGQAQADRAILDVACPPEETEEEPCHYEPG